MIADDLFGSA